MHGISPTCEYLGTARFILAGKHTVRWIYHLTRDRLVKHGGIHAPING